jgi:hypothetical protein
MKSPLRRALFYSGSVLKAEDLDGALSLIDAIVDQVVSVHEFQDAEALFYFGSTIRHRIETHRKIDKFEAHSLRSVRVVGGYVLNDAREVFARRVGKDYRIHLR